MAPNLFLCLRTVFCPVYWCRPSLQIQGAIFEDEHWEKPVPGTYRYLPGHGWHLIERDDPSPGEYESPEPVVYCQILHRYLLASDMEKRCRSLSVITDKGAKPQEFRFFLLDDGATWVAGWDAKDRFIPGPYLKWYFDKERQEMRPKKAISIESTESRKGSFQSMEKREPEVRVCEIDGPDSPTQAISRYTNPSEAEKK
ncbi:hypothetical protein AJ79_05422 [Helicocarpus griseus UAMH5409]|uniref:Uncharacterized protein n=1 Tax=Helicocarpus griseus UAMH5409 TaxID=1447875 RepID=A0A2B7XFN3_9EURO|nr:hypothetical protein AJ79_05422 [Helicocarpus griseus UAMH5409]